MNKFLDELSKMLKGNIPDSYVKSNLDYYRQYIYEEKSKGRKEADIVAELGDPRLIAKNIINTSPVHNVNSNKAYYEEYDDREEENKNYQYSKVNQNYTKRYGRTEQSKSIGVLGKLLNNKVGRVLVAISGFIVAAVIICLVISLIGMLLAVLLPIIGVVILVKIIIRIIVGK